MYRESMAAGLTLAEVRAVLRRSRLSMARVAGFRMLDYSIVV